MTRPPGVWMLYYDDYGPRLESIHTSIEPPVREVSGRGYGKVGWLPYGVELQEAVRAWEAGEYEEDPEPKIEWRDPAPQTNEEVADAMEQMAKAFGVELTDWQSRAVRYFLNDTVTEKCGDHPAPCNHDPAHPKDPE